MQSIDVCVKLNGPSYTIFRFSFQDLKIQLNSTIKGPFLSWDSGVTFVCANLT